MSYCDDCIIKDICCAEGKDDEAMTFCADKDRFIEKTDIMAMLTAQGKMIGELAGAVTKLSQAVILMNKED